MKVGINATWLATHTGGIRTYVRNLIRALATVDPDSDYILYSNVPLPEAGLPDSTRMRRLIVRSGNRLLRIPFATSLALARAGIDVVHEQIIAPFVFPSRIVVTVHDTLHEHYPDFYTPSALRQLRLLMPITMRRATAVLTDSEFCKREIVQLYRVPPEKVTAVPLAADPMFRRIHDETRIAAVRARYGTGERFVLFTGSLKPTKNLKAVVEAYVRLRRAAAMQHRLVLVGDKAWVLDDIFATARASGYADEIIFTGHVADEDLVALYNAADLFVHPSLFEGFGLPPLEAMACGTPVVTANTSAIPEVVGDAALMVDPHDVEALASAIAMVLDDGALRARLSVQGLERAASFSWEATARTIAGVYRDVVRATRR